LVLDAVRLRASERLLFLQCGDGWIVEEAWRRGRSRIYARGLDTSPQLVARARALRGVPGNVEFGTWGGERLANAGDSFHRVFTTFALQGASDPVSVLRALRGVLETDGDLHLLELERLSGTLGAGEYTCTQALRDAGFDVTGELGQREVSLGDGEGGVVVLVHARRSALPAASFTDSSEHLTRALAPQKIV
jgi:ubiquinone/menaquinone biosynthesis C-methylase UbiE